MSLLTGTLPTAVEICGRQVKIRADFRAGLAFERARGDETLDQLQRLALGLSVLYEEVPDEIGAAVDRALWFYRCGREESGEAAGAADAAPSAGPRIYSFEEDAPYIYAAFLSQYGLDLTEIPFLHWWKFKALFGALEERHEFVKIMRYRSVAISPKMTAEEQKFYRTMKRLYALPDKRSEEEKQRDFINALAGGL